MTQPKPTREAPKAPTRLTEPVQDRKVDVQATWRKHGWKPLAERKNDPSPSK